MSEKKEYKLPEKLQLKLDAVGDNPIDEPEIYAMMEEGKKRSEVFKKVASGLKMGDFSAKDVAEFIKAVNMKIVSPRKENGEWKTTPGTEDCDMPDYETCEDFYYMVKERLTDKTMTKDKVEKSLEDEDKVIWAVSGLKKDKLTEWEQDLVRAQLRSFMMENAMTALGFELKN